MHMRASLDRRDDRHAYVGYIFQNLSAFIMNLAPHAGIGDVSKRRPIDIRNELSACARQDHDLVGPILPNAVEGIDEFGVSWSGHNERPTVGVEFSNQHTFSVTRQFQVAI